MIWTPHGSRKAPPFEAIDPQTLEMVASGKPYQWNGGWYRSKGQIRGNMSDVDFSRGLLAAVRRNPIRMRHELGIYHEPDEDRQDTPLLVAWELERVA